jgi:hypothetical protein
MDEISSSPVVRDMFQAAIDVVGAGYRVLLRGRLHRATSDASELEIALTNHARAAEKKPSQAFAGLYPRIFQT